jgi:4-alpha-glucanotransferase
LSSETGVLLKLAQLYGIQTAFYGIHQKRHTASVESLLAILKSLEAPVQSMEDVSSACHIRKKWFYDKLLEPVIVAWEGKLDSVIVRLLAPEVESKISICLTGEGGFQTDWELSGIDLPVITRIEHDNSIYFEKKVSLGAELPFGYYKLTIETQQRHSEVLVLSAPMRTYLPETKDRKWGVFLPLYSLHTRKSPGIGTYSDLHTLIDWVRSLGGASISSLPLLPTFLDKPYEPSPYLPISKLLWNELYIDVSKVAELENCHEAMALTNSLTFQQKVQSLQRDRLVDYREQMKIKKAVLKILSQHFFSYDSPRRREFESFISDHANIDLFARFRAVMERQNTVWQKWQSELREGNLRDSDFDKEIWQYHLYVQWLAHEQMREAAKHALEKGVGLYIDLPLGTHPNGFDAWRYKNNFVQDVTAGAPPDIVFTNGQNWSFPPLHPDTIRETGYSYVISYLRHHLEMASMLRVDHVMGLHRLFFIPSGFESRQGTYVRYHADELSAIYCIESQRHQSIIVGEDLGIVPRVVRKEMKRHGFRHMWVMYYELAANAKTFLSSPQPDTVASLNTHDMPTFASFWEMRDIADRVRTGIITSKMAQKDKSTRTVVKQQLHKFLAEKKLLDKRLHGARAALKGSLSLLALGRSRLLQVNLEDLWLETNSQNIPGTTNQHPNWSRKARYDLESFCQMPQVVTILKEINRLRLLKGSKSDTR